MLEVDKLLVVDVLNGLSGMHRNRGAQGRMAVHQRLKRAPDRRDVHIGANESGKADIVDRTLRRQLAQEPDPLLIIRQRMEPLELARFPPQELAKQRTFVAR